MSHDPGKCKCEDCRDWRIASELTAVAYGGYYAIQEKNAVREAEEVRYRVYMGLRRGYRVTFEQVLELVSSTHLA